MCHVLLGAPTSGKVEPQQAAKVAKALSDMGCYEVSVGRHDSAYGTPASIACCSAGNWQSLSLQRSLQCICMTLMAKPWPNILAALQMGITVADASVAGLGGCPYAKAATGNVATEDVVYMLDGLGIQHGVELK